MQQRKLLLTLSARVCVGIKLCILRYSVESVSVIATVLQLLFHLSAAKASAILTKPLNLSCNANTNSPEAAKFQNSIFSPPNDAPAQSRPRRMPLSRLPSPFPPPLIALSSTAQAYFAADRTSAVVWPQPKETFQRLNSVFTALHAMRTRSRDENSVCPSIRLSHA